MRGLLAGAAALVVLALTAPARADPPQTGVVHVQVPPGTGLRELGAQLYAANCVSCHGVDGVGVPPRAKESGAGELNGAGPSLRGVGALAADFELRTGFMPLHEVGEQPTRSRVLFTERELRGLIAYVASLGRGPPVPMPRPERGNLAAGLRLFTDHCAGCHQIVAQGGVVTGAVAPPLGDATPVQIAEAVRIGPYLMPRFPRSQISDRDLDSIVRYVQETKSPDDPGGFGIGHIGPVPEGIVAWLIAGAGLVAVSVLIGSRLR
jgi:ubiquinol-cytochrome c reductase cytochrome c subunit